MGQIMPFAFFRGNITPADEAKISIASHSLQYGTTCFAGIKGTLFKNKVRVFRLKDHHERLMNAVKILGMNYELSFDEFQGIIGTLIAKNRPEGDFFIYAPLFSRRMRSWLLSRKGWILNLRSICHLCRTILIQRGACVWASQVGASFQMPHFQRKPKEEAVTSTPF